MNGGKFMNKVPFIAIEGPIGVGKTSLAKKLSNSLDYRLLKEIVEENPFLDKFYDNIEEWSFQTEMFFLCNRHKQLQDIDRDYLQNRQPVIADYHIFKNMIFANQSLNKDEFKKYEHIFKILTEDLKTPNMVIYIHASLDTLLKRIKQRGRELEKNIQQSYLLKISQDYEEYMNKFEATHPNVPVIRINGDNNDFISRQDDLDIIISRVETKLKKQLTQQI